MAALDTLNYDTEAEERPNVRMVPPATKNPWSLGKPTEPVGVDASILERMQQLLEEKQRQQGSFAENIYNAIAMATPAPYRAQAVEAREKTQAGREQDIFQMQTEIARQKAAQEAAKNFQQSLGYGVTPSTGKTSGAMAKWQEMINSLPENMQPQALDALKRGDSKAWNDIFQKVGMETVKGLAQPGAHEEKYNIFIPDESGKPVLYQVSLPVKQKLIREGKGFEPGTEMPSRQTAPAQTAPAQTAPAQTAPAQTAPAQTAPAPSPKPTVTPASTITGNLTPEEAALPSAPMRTAAAMPANFTFSELSPAQRDKLSVGMGQEGLIRDSTEHASAASVFDKMPIEKRKKVFAALSEEPPVQVVAAPTPTTTDVTAPTAPRRAPPLSQIRAEEEFRKNLGAETVKQWAKEEEYHREDLRSSTLREINSREIINTLTKDPQITGILQTPGQASAFATLLKTGISAPGGHSFGIKEIDDAMFKGQPGRTKEEIALRDRLRTLLDTAALHGRALLKGGGQISDFEQKMLQSMVGSLDNTPENIIKIQKIAEANAQQRKILDNAWKTSGFASYGEFVAKSPEYTKLIESYDERLKKIADEKIVLNRSGSQAAPHPGKKFLDLYPPRKP